jgi:hypothetical protein
VGGEDSPHEDGGAASPNSRFNDITGYVVGQHLGHAGQQIVHSQGADHRFRSRWPVSSPGPLLAVAADCHQPPAPILEQGTHCIDSLRPFRQVDVVHFFVDEQFPCQAAAQEIKVKVGCSGLHVHGRTG